MEGKAMSPTQTFYQEPSEQSQIKAKIVKSYFDAWSLVMQRHWAGNIAYIDLFCGPGKYMDGNKSVPLMLVEKALSSPELLKRMLFAFNDAEQINTINLEKEIRVLPNSNVLLPRIQFTNYELSTDSSVFIQVHSSVPVLSFVDPWGYKGLSLELINQLIKNNGSDCIFFFNYNRINMALSNTLFDEHLAGIFGLDITKELKMKLAPLSTPQREQVILDALISVLRGDKANYVLPFKFYSQEMLRTSHFIIFVSKHPAGYRIMKEIMYANSAKDPDGVASFSYEDTYNFGPPSGQLTIFSKLDDLCSKLSSMYSGKKISIKTICDVIVQDTSNLFVESNIKDALRRMEENGFVAIEGRKQKMRNGKVTMPNTAYALFRK